MIYDAVHRGRIGIKFLEEQVNKASIEEHILQYTKMLLKDNINRPKIGRHVIFNPLELNTHLWPKYS